MFLDHPYQKKTLSLDLISTVRPNIFGSFQMESNSKNTIDPLLKGPQFSPLIKPWVNLTSNSSMSSFYSNAVLILIHSFWQNVHFLYGGILIFLFNFHSNRMKMLIRQRQLIQEWILWTWSWQLKNVLSCRTRDWLSPWNQSGHARLSMWIKDQSISEEKGD